MYNIEGIADTGGCHSQYVCTYFVHAVAALPCQIISSMHPCNFFLQYTDKRELPVCLFDMFAACAHVCEYVRMSACIQDVRSLVAVVMCGHAWCSGRYLSGATHPLAATRYTLARLLAALSVMRVFVGLFACKSDVLGRSSINVNLLIEGSASLTNL